MELKYSENELNIRCEVIESQILVQGNVPVLDGKSARSLLLAKPHAEISSVEVMRDRILMEGHLSIDAVCTTPGGEVFSFTSSAPFKHRVDMEATDRKLRGEADVSIQTLNVRPEGMSLSLEAALDVSVSLFDELPLSTLYSVEGIDDAEFDFKNLTVTKKIKVGGGRLRLREITSTEGISAVLYTEGCAVISGITPDAGENEATVTGTITASALCMNSTGQLSEQTRQVAFEESLPIAANSNEPLFATARIESISLRPAAELISNGAVEALLCIDIFELKTESISLPIDFFSPSGGISAISRGITIQDPGMPIFSTQTIRESISLPEGMPEIEHPIYAQARPIVTLSETESGMTHIEGIFITRVIYRTDAGMLYAFDEDVPFSISVNTPSHDCAMAALPCVIAVISPASASSVDITYTVELMLKPICENTIQVVTGISECECEDRPLGVLIYFAEAGDTLFSIAKKLLVSTASLKAVNPSLPEVMHGGERIVVMI